MRRCPSCSGEMVEISGIGVTCSDCGLILGWGEIE